MQVASNTSHHADEFERRGSELRPIGDDEKKDLFAAREAVWRAWFGGDTKQLDSAAAAGTDYDRAVIGARSETSSRTWKDRGVCGGRRQADPSRVSDDRNPSVRRDRRLIHDVRDGSAHRRQDAHRARRGDGSIRPPKRPLGQHRLAVGAVNPLIQCVGGGRRGPRRRRRRRGRWKSIWSTGIRSGIVVMSAFLMPLRQQVLPVRDDVGAISVDVQPGQRFRQRCALEESSLGARRRLQVHHPWDQAEHLLQAFDIAARDGEDTQIDAAFRWVRVEARAVSDEAKRIEERAGQHRVGQRIRRGSELAPIRIDRLHGAPERGRRVVEFRRDLFQQSDVVQLAECVGGVTRAQDLEATPRAVAAPRCARFRV